MTAIYMVLASIILGTATLTLIGCASTPTEEGTGEFFDDSVITTKVKAAILRDNTLKVTEISVNTFKGDVTLGGTVDTADMAKIAVKIAQGVAGVKSVKSNLKVK